LPSGLANGILERVGALPDPRLSGHDR